mmetsp:Transcript_28315/g.90618  ORF Transcript_28315/g.90618 Transcript_28315/m.90618 type:complete len:283 (-) Transcript_28315:317-1165(-)
MAPLEHVREIPFAHGSGGAILLIAKAFSPGELDVGVFFRPPRGHGGHVRLCVSVVLIRRPGAIVRLAHEMLRLELLVRILRRERHPHVRGHAVGEQTQSAVVLYDLEIAVPPRRRSLHTIARCRRGEPCAALRPRVGIALLRFVVCALRLALVQHRLGALFDFTCARVIVAAGGVVGSWQVHGLEGTSVDRLGLLALELRVPRGALLAAHVDPAAQALRLTVPIVYCVVLNEADEGPAEAGGPAPGPSHGLPHVAVAHAPEDLRPLPAALLGRRDGEAKILL